MRSSNIVTLTELRNHLSDYVQAVNRTGEPVYLTRLGEAAAVLLSPSAHDRLADKAELFDLLFARDSSGLAKSGTRRSRRMRQLARRVDLPITSLDFSPGQAAP